ncbi:hypothetical protein BDV37DRAFT_15469 [Aspergillus pseudonomiae]|uniref:Uncharacterized protein n=1 Tax=Aspergillus pseudonomiae TaxID=1506151 RepID=A0A5N7CXR3_9EURO|nr:uncharacterized protein BDV37DRAFT_15469 [Aspergillus pseudonomiae]KAE8398961.1 hypothetical protein BDV37DRAFT_15469 [Aspergillus pseudonomiae]
MAGWRPKIISEQTSSQWSKTVCISPNTLQIMKELIICIPWILKFRNQTAKKDDERDMESERPAGGNTRSASQGQNSYNDPVEATLRVGHRGTMLGPSANHAVRSKSDQDKCIVTKAGEPNDTAHIFGRPFGIRHQQKDAHDVFWNTLKLF